MAESTIKLVFSFLATLWTVEAYLNMNFCKPCFNVYLESCDGSIKYTIGQVKLDFDYMQRFASCYECSKTNLSQLPIDLNYAPQSTINSKPGSIGFNRHALLNEESAPNIYYGDNGIPIFGIIGQAGNAIPDVAGINRTPSEDRDQPANYQDTGNPFLGGVGRPGIPLSANAIPDAVGINKTPLSNADINQPVYYLNNGIPYFGSIGQSGIPLSDVIGLNKLSLWNDDKDHPAHYGKNGIPYFGSSGQPGIPLSGVVGLNKLPLWNDVKDHPANYGKNGMPYFGSSGPPGIPLSGVVGLNKLPLWNDNKDHPINYGENGIPYFGNAGQPGIALSDVIGLNKVSLWNDDKDHPVNYGENGIPYFGSAGQIINTMPGFVGKDSQPLLNKDRDQTIYYGDNENLLLGNAGQIEIPLPDNAVPNFGQPKTKSTIPQSSMTTAEKNEASPRMDTFLLEHLPTTGTKKPSNEYLPSGDLANCRPVNKIPETEPENNVVANPDNTPAKKSLMDLEIMSTISAVSPQNTISTIAQPVLPFKNILPPPSSLTYVPPPVQSVNYLSYPSAPNIPNLIQNNIEQKQDKSFGPRFIMPQNQPDNTNPLYNYFRYIPRNLYQSMLPYYRHLNTAKTIVPQMGLNISARSFGVGLEAKNTFPELYPYTMNNGYKLAANTNLNLGPVNADLSMNAGLPSSLTAQKNLEETATDLSALEIPVPVEIEQVI